jgi:hypothetical protein
MTIILEGLCFIAIGIVVIIFIAKILTMLDGDE